MLQYPSAAAGPWFLKTGGNQTQLNSRQFPRPRVVCCGKDKQLLFEVKNNLCEVPGKKLGARKSLPPVWH